MQYNSNTQAFKPFSSSLVWLVSYIDSTKPWLMKSRQKNKRENESALLKLKILSIFIGDEWWFESIRDRVSQVNINVDRQLALKQHTDDDDRNFSNSCR